MRTSSFAGSLCPTVEDHVILTDSSMGAGVVLGFGAMDRYKMTGRDCASLAVPLHIMIIIISPGLANNTKTPRAPASWFVWAVLVASWTGFYHQSLDRSIPGNNRSTRIIHSPDSRHPLCPTDDINRKNLSAPWVPRLISQ